MPTRRPAGRGRAHDRFGEILGPGPTCASFSLTLVSTCGSAAPARRAAASASARETRRACSSAGFGIRIIAAAGRIVNAKHFECRLIDQYLDGLGNDARDGADGIADRRVLAESTAARRGGARPRRNRHRPARRSRPAAAPVRAAPAVAPRSAGPQRQPRSAGRRALPSCPRAPRYPDPERVLPRAAHGRSRARRAHACARKSAAAWPPSSMPARCAPGREDARAAAPPRGTSPAAVRARASHRSA